MNYANNILNIIGNTPLLKINTLNKGKASIFAKLEMFNPLSSVKDRAALAMISSAEKNGLLKPGGAIVEPTSGNTGIALAYIASVKGYKFTAVMPDSLSAERRKIMAALGAKLLLTEGKYGMKGAIEKAALVAKETNAFMPMQFENPANPQAHYETTGPEIYAALKQPDILIAGVGTGGTITGAGTFLKEKNKNIKIIAVEPADSHVLSGGKPSPHAIEGIGAGFIPKTLNTQLLDGVITVTKEDAFNTARDLAKSEGVFAGVSSGAAMWAALETAKNPENAQKNIVVILPDTGERYLSTALF